MHPFYCVYLLFYHYGPSRGLERTLLYSKFTFSKSFVDNSDRSIAPANEAIQWNVAPWPAGDGLSEPFVGYPRPELEEAWHGLLGSRRINVLLCV